MDVRIIRARNDADFSRLYELLIAYERSLPADLRHGLEPEPEDVPRDYAAPNAGFLALLDTAAAGCIAVTKLDASTAVLKRLYVEPAYRKDGAGRALVAAAVAFAREGGYRRVVLDTDRDRLSAAYKLYLAFGFRDCEPYGPVDYATPTFMELRL